MASKERLDLYDKILGYMITKMNKSCFRNTISLASFNPKDENHLCIFHAARIIHDVGNVKLEVDLNLWQWWKFQKKFQCKDYVKRFYGILPVFCDILTEEVEKEFGEKGILAEIYKEFYK